MRRFGGTAACFRRSDVGVSPCLMATVSFVDPTKRWTRATMSLFKARRGVTYRTWMPFSLVDLSDSNTGSKAASVFPEPVGATIRMSEPPRIWVIATTCIGFSLTIPARSNRFAGINSVMFLILFLGKAFQEEVRRNKLPLWTPENVWGRWTVWSDGTRNTTCDVQVH